MRVLDFGIWVLQRHPVMESGAWMGSFLLQKRVHTSVETPSSDT